MGEGEVEGFEGQGRGGRGRKGALRLHDPSNNRFRSPRHSVRSDAALPNRHRSPPPPPHLLERLGAQAGVLGADRGRGAVAAVAAAAGGLLSLWMGEAARSARQQEQRQQQLGVQKLGAPLIKRDADHRDPGCRLQLASKLACNL